METGQWLIAAGSQAAKAYSIAPGDTLQLFCLLPPAQRPLYEALGGGPRILRDGGISIEYERERLSRAFAEDRHPRTAVGYTQDQSVLFLLVVDGRQPGYSVGMSLEELAHFMRTQLGDFSLSKENAYQGLNLDGGGSSTMVVEGEVVNSPSDQTGERPVANALIIAGAQ
jgi:exopolysaccharide biosynthesis protein